MSTEEDSDGGDDAVDVGLSWCIECHDYTEHASDGLVCTICAHDRAGDDAFVDEEGDAVSELPEDLGIRWCNTCEDYTAIDGGELCAVCSHEHDAEASVDIWCSPCGDFRVFVDGECTRCGTPEGDEVLTAYCPVCDDHVYTFDSAFPRCPGCGEEIPCV